jgi:DNA repair ATPase RecN
MTDAAFSNASTDFEKLLLANAFIKQLRRERGEMQSELDEYKDKTEELKAQLEKLKQNKTDEPELTPLSKEERKELKKEQVYKSLRATIKELNGRVKKLENEKDILIGKLHRK